MSNTKNEKPKRVRVVALIVVALLVIMIIATLICAIAGVDKNIIMGLLLCDMIIPIFIWVFLKVTGRLTDRRKEAENE